MTIRLSNLEAEHLLCLLDDAIEGLNEELEKLPASIQKMDAGSLKAQARSASAMNPHLSERQQDINLAFVNRNYIAHYERIIRKLGF